MYNIKEIIDRYEGGEGTWKIAKSYNTYPQKINDLLRSNGITIRKDSRKNTFDLSFFEEINSPEKAYCLGYLYGDGSINKNGVSFFSADRDVIDKISNVTQFSRKPELDLRGKLDIYYIRLNSRKVVKDVKKLGRNQYKKDLVWVDDTIVPNNLKKYFILGLYDSDGGLYFNKTDLIRDISIAFTGSKSIIVELSNFIEVELDIEMNAIYKHKECYLHYLRSYKKSTIITILDWLYDRAPIYMKRKHDKYLQLKQS